MIPLGAVDLAPEEELLVRLCRRDADTRLDGSDLEPLESEAFRRRFRDLASDQRVAGLALLTLERRPSAKPLSSRALEELYRPGPPTRHGAAGGSPDRSRSFDALCRRAEDQDRELERLVGLLEAEALDPLVLKGPALRRIAYQQPVARRYGDFDLLFPPGDVERAIRVMDSAGYRFPFSEQKLQGYRAFHFHALLRSRRGFRAEIHWALSKPKEPFRLDPEAFLRRCVWTQPPRKTPFRVPCVEHLLLHAAQDNLRDSFSRLSRIVDVDRILAAAPDLDWDYTLAQARAGGLTHLLALSLETSERLLGAAVPAPVRAALRPDTLSRIHLASMCRPSSLLRGSLRGAGGELSFRLWSCPGWRERVHLLARSSSGEGFSDDWIFRDREEARPSRRRTLVVGLKSALRLAAYHAALYLSALLPRRLAPRRSEGSRA